MSNITDPLTQGINTLTAYANEVTGASDTNLSDAVYTLAQGYSGFNPFAVCTYCSNMFQGAELPETLVIDFENNAPASLANMFYSASGINNLTIKNLGSVDGGIPMSHLFHDISATTITLENCNLVPSTCSRILTGSVVVSLVGGKIDMSNSTTTDAIYYSRNLESVEFVESTIHANFSLSGATSLSNASLVSIANGLDETASGYSITGSSKYTNTFASIIGTVIDGTFVIDELGDTTLADFITNTKGWTLA